MTKGARNWTRTLRLLAAMLITLPLQGAWLHATPLAPNSDQPGDNPIAHTDPQADPKAAHPPAQLAQYAANCTILLHGLWRSANSLGDIASDLEMLGHVVVRVDYPSQTQPIARLAAEYIPRALAACPWGSRVYFVTHSMGAILLRSYYKQFPRHPRPHGAVMLGPPNKGSEVIDHPSFGYYSWAVGAAGSELGTHPLSTPNLLGPVDFPVGIIAGTMSINPVFSDLIAGVDDGAVAVESTRLEGASDWIALPVNHSFMMKDPRVRYQILHFLNRHKFDHQR